MQVVMIRTNGVNPDPRVEKEVNSIIKDGANSVLVLAWNRESKIDTDALLNLPNGTAKIIRFGIPSEWGGGFKKNLIPLIKFALRVNRWLKKNESSYDCIHCCDLPTAMMASPYIKRKKFIYDIFDYFADTAHAPKFILNYARKKEKRMIEEADVTIICSEQRKAQIAMARPKKLVVIHNSPDSSLLDDVLKEQKHILKSSMTRKKLVYVGNLISERYVDLVANIVSKNNDIEFHVGGIGPLASMLSDYAKQFDNIYFYGKMNYSDVICLEHDCDIMLALYDPSVRNNQYAAPNKFYESLLVGKPLVMIKNTGFDRIVSEKLIGAVANSTTVEDIGDAIKKAILISESDQTIEDRMKRLYDEYYSWEIMDNRLCELYNSIK